MIKKLVLILMAILVVSCKQVSTDEATKWVENDEGLDIYMDRPSNYVLEMKKGQTVRVPYYRNPTINFVGFPQKGSNLDGSVDPLNNIVVKSIDANYMTIEINPLLPGGNTGIPGQGTTGVGMMLLVNSNSEGRMYKSNSLLVRIAE